MRKTLAEALRGQNIQVIDGNNHQGYLFQDTGRYKTKTDIVFRGNKKDVIGLGEVKYKPKLKEADRYQIISHVTAANAPIGILFIPANEQESQGPERLGRLATGAQFFSYRVNIQEDIETAQATMTRDVLALLQLH